MITYEITVNTEKGNFRVEGANLNRCLSKARKITKHAKLTFKLIRMFEKTEEGNVTRYEELVA